MNPIGTFYFFKEKLSELGQAMDELFSAPGRALDRVDSRARECINGYAGYGEYSVEIDVLCFFHDHPGRNSTTPRLFRSQNLRSWTPDLQVAPSSNEFQPMRDGIKHFYPFEKFSR